MGTTVHETRLPGGQTSLLAEVVDSSLSSVSAEPQFLRRLTNVNIQVVQLRDSIRTNDFIQCRSHGMMINITVPVQMGTKALFACPSVPPTKAVLITWVITLRGQPPCIVSFKVKTKEINETSCVDRRIVWVFTPDQNPHLQINAVALDHDRHYSCQITTSDGNFYARWDLQVLVPPAVTLFPGKSRTAVCEVTAGKPAAQIFWTPDGECKTMNESHSNGTVTVRSTWQWEKSNVSAVFCLVTHSNGSEILSIELNQGVTSMSLHSLLTILYVKLSLWGIILFIVGFVFFQKRNYFR
ncbi:cell surface glycoprotein CD200 receptor 2-like [Onychomys torridus]|uniref:cell surface glycoprotein CD200 receptor 2-like n=1 Tax=Onychomys torridus TaxID=38674 RepID=UPI00167F86B4|nr:cell surface glycoprotein CD200 receptor 2-like [Onychomys torridus]